MQCISRSVCVCMEYTLLLCDHVCVVCLLLVEYGGSVDYTGDLKQISFSKCAGSAWHALRLLSPCYRLCWL